MKKLLIIIAILGLSASMQLAAQNKLTTIVSGIEDTEGTIYVALFDQTSFLKKRIAGKRVAIDNNEVRVEFTDVPEGVYAIAVYQDKNGNEELDRGMFGIPSERYGFSNNAKPTMGPPRFSECRFEVKEDTAINISLQ